MMRVLGLHRVPLDEAAIQQAIVRNGKECESQIRDCWQSAWLLVVEPGPGFDINRVSLANSPNPANRQVPWNEETLADGRIAFFLHYYSPGDRLLYGDEEVRLPPPTPAPEALLSQVRYEAPD